MRDEYFLKDLNRFLGKAALATYAGGGAETTPERGFLFWRSVVSWIYEYLSFLHYHRTR